MRFTLPCSHMHYYVETVKKNDSYVQLDTISSAVAEHIFNGL